MPMWGHTPSRYNKVFRQNKPLVSATSGSLCGLVLSLEAEPTYKAYKQWRTKLYRVSEFIKTVLSEQDCLVICSSTLMTLLYFCTFVGLARPVYLHRT